MKNQKKKFAPEKNWTRAPFIWRHDHYQLSYERISHATHIIRPLLTEINIKKSNQAKIFKKNQYNNTQKNYIFQY